jgi:Cdc6-like AAA superfamily ATPase
MTDAWLEERTRASDLLLSKKQVIFYGPPGTGKTYEAQRFAASFLSGDPKNNLHLASRSRKLGELEGEIVATLTANSWVDRKSSKTLAGKYGCSIQTVAALKAHIYKQRILGKSWRSKK